MCCCITPRSSIDDTTYICRSRWWNKWHNANNNNNNNNDIDTWLIAPKWKGKQHISFDLLNSLRSDGLSIWCRAAVILAISCPAIFGDFKKRNSKWNEMEINIVFWCYANYRKNGKNEKMTCVLVWNPLPSNRIDKQPAIQQADA